MDFTLLKNQFKILIAVIFSTSSLYAQSTIYGKITAENQLLAKAHIVVEGTKIATYSNDNGEYILKKVPAGNQVVKVSMIGYITTSSNIYIFDKEPIKLDFILPVAINQLDEISVIAEKEKQLGTSRLNDVEGTAIYAGKKSEVVVMDDVAGNLATNNSRQIYAKIAGLNIWESDGAGLQLGIGGRGLNPNRTSNFNTRQNGYDISADALGYPESYYTPPAEALERIEIVRGAASLQYGTQFGGFINFRLKQAPIDKKISLTSRLTYGSWNLLNSFNSISGTINKFSYYVFYQHKQGDGWRPNSQFNVNTAFGGFSYQFSEKFKIGLEYTFMDYLAQQPGGLTDAMFDRDPSISIRKRNWFKVNWNLMALTADYKFSDRLKFNTRTFGLIANKSALGVLSNINRIDTYRERDLWMDNFTNIGNENRLIYNYKINTIQSVALVGTRYYHGTTFRRQGLANRDSTGKREDFRYINPGELEYSEFTFPNKNFSAFAENIFQITERWNITPGVRFEYINTNAAGYYNQVNRDFAQNVLSQIRIEESRNNSRSFVIAGIGTSYNFNSFTEVYSNFSQNYRSINFNDIRVVNPNFRVDPNLQDERGYTADLGVRGSYKNFITYDLSAFLISYTNKIGSLMRVDSALFNTYRFRTNVSDAKNYGFESFVEADIWKLLLGANRKAQFSVFSNFSVIDARYIKSAESAYRNKQVEFVPKYVWRSGITYRLRNFGATLQYSYVSEQFTDATNAIFTANAVNGIIPAYYVADFSIDYTYRGVGLFAGINNITNNMYFTRRAEGYPGPGIIPSDARSFYITLQVKL
jgi:Fe(3+) dicitrate transport protein